LEGIFDEEIDIFLIVFKALNIRWTKQAKRLPKTVDYE
jgi:hypothetical protein